MIAFCEKMKFKSRDKALRKAKQYLAFPDTTARMMHAYFCEQCDYWHLSAKNKGRRNRILAKKKRPMLSTPEAVAGNESTPVGVKEERAVGEKA